MRKTIGIVAHVDAGKTTFSERVLYLAGAVRAPGRVDHQDTFLDTDRMERSRGITIFSGQAVLRLGGDTVYWLDTPGHADFSAEMERALSVLDYAVLVVSAADGVQSHTETLWQLLADYAVPTFVFLNKTDREGADADAVLREMRARLSPDFLDFRAWQAGRFDDEAFAEEAAAADERLLDALFGEGYDRALWERVLTEDIRARRVFPVCAGSALTGGGVDGFLALLQRLTRTDYDADAPFAAEVFQVRHDARGQRLCHVKLLGGRLAARDSVALPGGPVKVSELFTAHGARLLRADGAEAGDLVVLPGMEGLKAGMALGAAAPRPFRSEPMMAADVLFDAAGTTSYAVTQALRVLEDEEPTLHVETREGLPGVHVMGRIQLEVLKGLMEDRFGLHVRFGPPRVLYRETVTAPCVGIGHYEPLRHYAEVWLRVSPGAPGSGVVFASECHVDDLALNWQRLICTHVMEKAHRGVLTGSPLTDVVVTLLKGRAHLKHTEGGDFRQAVYRAVRNALMHGQSALLEPWCAFSLTFPGEHLPAVTGSLLPLMCEDLDTAWLGESVRVTGVCPYRLFAGWQDSFLMLTRGRGALRVRLERYGPCLDPDAAANAHYDPLADPEDTPDSVFCAHGAGFTVAWDRVADFAHLRD